MKRFLIGYALLTTCLLFMQREAQKPLLIYHADSKYQITGKVTEKRKIGNLFTIDVGKFYSLNPRIEIEIEEMRWNG